MRFKKLNDEEPNLGITPLIDIVFLLLIFFMLTSHFDMFSGVVIRLPEVGQKSRSNEDQMVKAAIDKWGNIYLEGKKIDLKTLSEKLEKLTENDEMISLVLEGDKETKHGRIVQVMDTAKRAGVLSIVIAARWQPEKVF
jgi:biopolymer transport protein ExbD